MNHSAEFAPGGTPYEYFVAEKNSRSVIRRRVVLILFYVLWVIGVLLLGVRLRLIAPLLAFIPFSLWLLIFFSWRITQVEYEYSFFSGQLTVSRILGGKSRRQLCSVSIRSLSAVFPYREPYARKAEEFAPDKVIFAASDLYRPDTYAAIWRDPDNNRKMLLWLTVDETALKWFRYYNRAAVTSAGKDSV